MDLENAYYNLNRTLMSIVGLWPYQKFKTRMPRMIISYGILCLSTTTLTAKFFTIKYDIDAIIDILSFLVPDLCYFVGYVTFHYNIEKIKGIYEWVRFDWTILQNQDEVNIMKKYATKSRNITIALIAIFYVFSSVVAVMYALPSMLDIVLPLNETRKRKSPIPFEMYYDIEDTIFGFILVVSTTMIIGIIAVSVYSAFLIGIYHGCGMLSITGYILEHAFVHDQYFTSDTEYEIISKKIVRSIKHHIRTIKFFEYIKDVAESCYSLQIALALILVGADYIKLMQLNKETLTKDVDKTIAFLFHIFGIMFSLFINCHAGQEVINHSIEIFHKATIAPWYLASKRTQNLSILMLMRSQVPCYIGVGKTFVSSYEFFASLLKTSMSYATVCYTMQ